MGRYKRNGLLQMLKRNLGVKDAPQRWQDNAADGAFDVVFTFEERVFDMVIEGLPISRPRKYYPEDFPPCIVWHSSNKIITIIVMTSHDTLYGCECAYKLSSWMKTFLSFSQIKAGLAQQHSVDL